MLASIQVWGNSQGIRIPKSILSEVHMASGEQVDIRVEDDRIVLAKSKEKVTLKNLFVGYERTYEGSEFDWGTPVGRELW